MTTITWSNGSGLGLASVGSDWYGNAAPGTADVALFNGGSTISGCTWDINAAVSGLVINAAYTGSVMVTGSLIVTSPNAAALVVSGGTLWISGAAVLITSGGMVIT